MYKLNTIFFLLLLPLLFSCNNDDKDTFENYIKTIIINSDNNTQKVYRELYTPSSTKEKGQYFCKELDNGISSDDLDHHIRKEVFSKEKLYDFEKYSLYRVNMLIKSTAIKYYCPQHKEKELRDRIK